MKPFKYINLQSVDSTNSYAKRMLEKEALMEETVILASEQTSGKGLGKSYWEAEPGKNLTFSIIIRPTHLPAAEQFKISIIASLAVAEYVKSMLKEDQKVSIKWPNDIYVGNNKIAGILIENIICGDEVTFSIVGIGININQEKFLSNAPNPVSLINITGKTYELGKCFQDLLVIFNNLYTGLNSDKFLSTQDSYHNHLYQLNIPAKFSVNGQLLKATIIGVNESGGLMLATEHDQMLICSPKEIIYLL